MERRSFSYYMRELHRDIGFFVIGLTVIYALSGLVLMYRDTGILKHEKQTEKHLPPNTSESELGMALHIRNFQVSKTDGDIVYFQNGTYNKRTGVASYTEMVLPAFLEKFNNLHRAPSKAIIHWGSLIMGIALLFLAISSFWMFKPKTRLFRRGLILAGIGIVAAIVLLLL